MAYVFWCLLICAGSIEIAKASWSYAFRRLFLLCMEHRTNSIAFLPDDVTGMEDLSLDACILACRRRGVSFMALKTSACYCTEFVSSDYVETTPDKCKPVDCPQLFRCGKGNSLAFYRVCKDGHFGKSCEKKCFCESSTCRVRDGLCLDSEGRCQRGFVGKSCNLTDPCIKMQALCKNGGQCKVTKVGLVSASWYCDCAPGYFGSNCTEQCPLNRYGQDCVFNCHCKEDRPCFIGNGSCPFGCKAGHFGKDCSFVDRCLSHPCKNGGTCYRDEDDFFCDCTHLYTGHTCEDVLQPIDIVYDEGNEARRKKILEDEKKEMMLRMAKEKLGSGHADVLGIVSLDEDRWLFSSLAEYVVDKIQEILFRKPIPENRVEDIDIDLGCFRELPALQKQQRDLQGHVELMARPMSVEACRRLCRQKGHLFAGAMKGDVCLCGDTYGRYGVASGSACSEPCSDNEELKCGGREAYSLFPVCRFGHYGRNCEFGCFCVEFPCDLLTGRCPGGFCRRGWTGPQCNKKHTSWLSTDRLATLLVVYLFGYLTVVTAALIYVTAARRKQEEEPDYKWYIGRN